MIGLLVLACGSDPAEPPALPRPDHAGAFAALVDAVARGDEVTARTLAGDVTLGEVDQTGPGASRVGGGLGMLQVADDRAEQRDALVAVAQGCGACHEARSVHPPPAPIVAHHRDAASLAAWAMVGAAKAPARPEGLPDAVAAAWPGLNPVLTACHGCHPVPEGSSQQSDRG